MAGDWNGDGIYTIGIFRNGTWFLDMDGDGRWSAGDLIVEFGQAGDIPVVGDWTGDGIAKLGVYRNGKFISRHQQQPRARRRTTRCSSWASPATSRWSATGPATASTRSASTRTARRGRRAVASVAAIAADYRPNFGVNNDGRSPSPCCNRPRASPARRSGMGTFFGLKQAMGLQKKPVLDEKVDACGFFVRPMSGWHQSDAPPCCGGLSRTSVHC